MHLNPNNFLACWEGAVGRVFSLDLMDDSVFSSFFVSRIINEEAIDVFRRELYFHLVKPVDLPSRLDCAFLFDNFSDAIDACTYWQSFNPQNLVPVSILNEANRFEADSNWLDILGDENFNRRTFQNIATRYWSGEPRNDRARTEILLRGIGRIDCQTTRARCFNIIVEHYPNAFGLLIRTMMTFDSRLSNFAGLVKYRLTPEAVFRPFCQFNEIHNYSRSQIQEYLRGKTYNVPKDIDWNAALFPTEGLSFTPHSDALRFLKVAVKLLSNTA